MRRLWALLLCGSLGAAPLVKLTLTDRAGAARAAEPLVAGVPLPEGLNLTDAAKFSLRDENGAVIPCEFRTASTWLKNPQAIKWLHLDFTIDRVPALGSRTLTLNSETSSPGYSSLLNVQDLGTTFQISTGKIRFTVRKANFDMFEGVFLEPSGRRVYTANGRGLVHKDSAGVEYRSSLDGASQVSVERQGPHAVQLKAAGTLKSAAGDSSFHFIVRITAFDRSNLVKVSTVIENRSQNIRSYLSIASLICELPLALPGALAVAAGLPGGVQQASLSGSSDEFYETATRSGGNFSPLTCTIGRTSAVQTVDVRKTLPRDLGWLSLSDSTGGCAVGMRYFWEMFPSGLTARGDGTLQAEFYSARQGQIKKMYAGQSRTRELRLCFFGPNTPADTLRTRMAGATDPLYALAPASWYCRATKAFGPMVEWDSTLFLPADWSQIRGAHRTLALAWDTLLSYVNFNPYLNNYNYGFLDWGDAMNDLRTYTPGGISDDWNITWDGNYYGLPHMTFMHFIRTADPRFLDFAVAHALHVEDLHQVHFGPTLAWTGGCRYCPPTNHVAADGLEDMIEIANPSHHKTQELFENYYLTGSERALETAMEGARWVRDSYKWSFSNPGSENLGVYVRRVSAQLMSQCYAYMQTKDRAFHSNIYQNWFFLKKAIATSDSIGVYWQLGIFYEALTDVHRVADDSIADSIPKYLKMHADSSYNSQGSNAAQGYAFLSQFYGPTYKARAVTKMNDFVIHTTDHTFKRFALEGRSLDKGMVYFAIPESLTIAAEGPGLKRVPENAFPFTVAPNPASTAFFFRASLNENARVTVSDLSGRRVAAFALKGPAGDQRKTWDSRILPAGVYLAALNAGNKKFVRKIVLVR